VLFEIHGRINLNPPKGDFKQSLSLQAQILATFWAVGMATGNKLFILMTSGLAGYPTS
jgi:hypothetical protein